MRSYLIETARIKSTVTYTQLNSQLGNLYDFSIPYDRKRIGEDLGEISEFEHKNGRPLLSALVVRSSDGYEGDGFYKLCDYLGYGHWENLKKSKTFDDERKQECYDFWRDNSNYSKFRKG